MANKKRTLIERFEAFDKKNKDRVRNSSPAELLRRSVVSGVLFALIIFVMDEIWPIDGRETDLQYYAVHGALFAIIIFLLMMLEKYVFPKYFKEKKRAKKSAKR